MFSRFRERIGFSAAAQGRKWLAIFGSLLIVAILLVSFYLVAESHGEVKVVSQVRKAENTQLSGDLEFCREEFERSEKRIDKMERRMDEYDEEMSTYELYIKEGWAGWPPPSVSKE